MRKYVIHHDQGTFWCEADSVGQAWLLGARLCHDHGLPVGAINAIVREDTPMLAYATPVNSVDVTPRFSPAMTRYLTGADWNIDTQAMS